MSRGNPLEPPITGGGSAAIFRKIACIGDSLASGEFEAVNEKGEKTYHDMYEYSWGQYMARATGATVYNFSRGGMSAGWYMDSFADEKGLWNVDLACQAYIMALGVNDISLVLAGERDIGDLSDIDKKDWRKNRHTVIGDYAAILQRYRTIEPDSFFFLMTIPRGSQDPERSRLEDRHRELLLGLKEMFPRVYILDLRKYAPVYDAEFHKTYFLGGHMNPLGYLYTSRLVLTYMDSIILDNPQAFAQVGFIGTPWRYRSALTLRPYESGDAGTILSWVPGERAFRQWSADRYDKYPAAPEDMDALYDRGGPGFFPFTVLEDGKIAGHFILRFPGGDRTRMRIGFMVVDSARRGQGLGRRIVEEAVRYAFQRWPVEKITLGVFGNNAPARRCYEAAGFRYDEDAERESLPMLGEEWECLEMERKRDAANP